MIKVRFIVDREVLDGAGNVVQHFKAGEVVNLPASSARRWVRRSIAEEVPYDTQVSVQPVVPAAVTEPEPGEAESQHEPDGSDAGEEQPSSSPEADQASELMTSPPSPSGKRRGRPPKHRAD